MGRKLEGKSVLPFLYIRIVLLIFQHAGIPILYTALNIVSSNNAFLSSSLRCQFSMLSFPGEVFLAFLSFYIISDFVGGADNILISSVSSIFQWICVYG